MLLQAQKSKLGFESQESVRKLNEMKHAIECAGLDKNKVASQLKDLQSNLDNVTREKMAAFSKVQAMEGNMKTIIIELEELRSVKISLEKQIIKCRDESQDWKKRYERSTVFYEY